MRKKRWADNILVTRFHYRRKWKIRHYLLFAFILVTLGLLLNYFISAGNSLSEDLYTSPQPEFNVVTDDPYEGFAAFSSPQGIAFFNDVVYVADTGNDAIRTIDLEGNVETLSLETESDEVDLLETWRSPRGIYVTEDGTVYVADTGNNMIKRILADGNVEIVAGTGVSGSLDGDSTLATFDSPSDVVVGEDGTVYVADTGNSLLRSISPSGEVTTIAGQGSIYTETSTTSSLPAKDVSLSQLHKLSIRQTLFGDEIILGSSFSRVWKQGSEWRIQGLIEADFGYSDSPNEPKIRRSEGVAVYGVEDDMILVADYCNQRIRLISEGELYTVAGTTPEIEEGSVSCDFGAYTDGSSITCNNGGGESCLAQFNYPRDVVANGNTIYVADSLNHVIRKVEITSVADGVVSSQTSTLSGIGKAGFSDGKVYSS